MRYTRDEINEANQSPSIGLVIRQQEPRVLETPLNRVNSFLMPPELFYVRNHSAGSVDRLSDERP
jgi:hypothetical protein